MANRYWCQQRFAERCQDISHLCLLCSESPGTLFHRRFRCPAHAAWRRDCLGSDLGAAAVFVSTLSPWAQEPFARGVLPDPTCWFRTPPGLPEDTVYRSNWPAEGLILEEGSHVFTDGSAFEPLLPRIRASGWAVVVTDGWGNVLRAIWGRVPRSVAPDQVARDGEDFAVVSLVRHALVSPGVNLHIDCSGTADLARDPSSAVCPDNLRSHLWQHVHDKLDGVLVHRCLLTARSATCWKEN